MGRYIGLDTSNYTTSAAVFDTETGVMRQVKRPLPVKEGELGLRQSDAVFHHTRQLPDVLEQLMAECGHRSFAIDGVAASDRPRQAEGSYMPCFLAGAGTARSLATVTGAPFYFFSHQQGHVAAAAFGAGRTDWLHRRFLAFHVSGGTTDALLVTPDGEDILRCETVAASLDLKAGQLIDRVGRMLGLPFPAGPALERLALGGSGGSAICRFCMREGSCRTRGFGAGWKSGTAGFSRRRLIPRITRQGSPISPLSGPHAVPADNVSVRGSEWDRRPLCRKWEV